MNALVWRRGELTARDLGQRMTRPVLAFTALIAAAFAVIGVIAATTGNLADGVGESMWENSGYATRYFPLALGVMLTTTFLPVYLANGVTRRSFSVGAGFVVFGIGAAMALLEALGYLAEHVLYRLAGASQEFGTPHLFDSGTQVWLAVPEVWIVVAAHVATGWLIGSAYHRWSWFWPTVALPVLLAPLAAVEALMSVGWPGTVMIEVLDVDRAPVGLAAAGALAVVAVTILLSHALVRRVAVRPSQA